MKYAVNDVVYIYTYDGDIIEGIIVDIGYLVYSDRVSYILTIGEEEII